VRGVRDSLSIVMRRPRWVGEETRVWNAVYSPCDAGRGLVRIELESGGIVSHLRFLTAFCLYFRMNPEKEGVRKS
jgi:hypothetical protein